jgi:competence protein ComEA
VLERSPAQLLAWALVAVLALAAGWKLLRPAVGGHGSGSPPIRVAGSGPTGGGGTQGRDGGVYIHVAGAVRRPGLYRLPGAARIAAALERAGGPTRRAQLDAVNLAARVEDGQQILVPRAGQSGGAVPAPVTSGAGAGGAAAAGPAAAAGGGAVGGVKVSLATATAEQPDTIDGIGPTLAQRIIAYRDQHAASARSMS